MLIALATAEHQRQLRHGLRVHRVLAGKRYRLDLAILDLSRPADEDATEQTPAAGGHGQSVAEHARLPARDPGKSRHFRGHQELVELILRDKG